MKFDQFAFNNFIVSSGVVGFFEQPIKLNSGRMSNWYVNYRKIASDVFLMDKLSDFVISLAKRQVLNLS